jgi:hypothetical protein
MREAVVLFHQGWTDIINSIGLVQYLSVRYDKLYVMIREDAIDLILYIFRDWSDSIVPIAVHRESLDEVHPYDILEMAGINVTHIVNHMHGLYDVYREDEYAEVYNKSRADGMFFVEAFYTPYTIPYSVRTEWFAVTRDEEREKAVYEAFTQLHGTEYGLQHLIDVESSKYPIISLNMISDYIFDMALVLDRAKEIHVIDSIWAAVIYHLQVKYGICSSIPVYISCKRGYDEMFSLPIKHPNWIWV